MTAEDLFDGVVNEKKDYDDTMFAIRHLRSMMDRAAIRLAKQYAKETDTQPGDHTPTREAKDEAIIALVQHYVPEITRHEQRQS